MKLAELFVDIMGRRANLLANLSVARSNLQSFSAFAAKEGTRAALGFGATFAASVAAAVDFESRMTGVEKAVGVSGEALGKLREELFALGRELKGVSLNDLVDIAVVGGKMGVPADQIQEFTRNVAKLSVALDDIPAQSIAEELGKIGGVFELTQRQTLGLGSAIDKLADSGTSSAGAILNVTQRLGSTAKLLGLTVTDAAALAAALLDTGVEAERAASSLMMLLNALADVEGQTAAAKQIGIPFEEFAALVKSKPIDAIKLFLQSIRSLSLGDAGKILKAIGIDATVSGGAILSLAQKTDTLSGYVAEAARQMDSLDQITQSYAARADDTGARLQSALNQLQEIGIKLGEAWLDPLERVVDLLGRWAGAAGDAGAASQALADQFGGAMERNFAVLLNYGTAIQSQWDKLMVLLGTMGSIIANPFDTSAWQKTFAELSIRAADSAQRLQDAMDRALAPGAKQPAAGPSSFGSEGGWQAGAAPGPSEWDQLLDLMQKSFEQPPITDEQFYEMMTKSRGALETATGYGRPAAENSMLVGVREQFNRIATAGQDDLLDVNREQVVVLNRIHERLGEPRPITLG